MSEERHTLETLARHLIRAAAPLVEAGASLGDYKRLMVRLGFRVTSIPAPFAALSVSVSGAQVKVDAFPAGAALTDVLSLLAQARGVFDGIRGLATGPPPAGVDPAAYATEIGRGLTDLLLTEYLAGEFRPAFNVLASVGVITLDPVHATATRPGFVRQTFALPELVGLVADPAGIPARVFKWGTPAFRADLLIERLVGLFGGLRFPVLLESMDDAALRGYLGLPGVRFDQSPRSMRMPFVYAQFAGKTVEASFAVHALGPHGAHLPGLVLEPRIPVEFGRETQLHPKVKLRLRAGTNAGSLFGITLRPNEIGVTYPLAPATPPPPGGLGIGFDFNPGAPTVLLGNPKASRLEFSSASVDLSADFANGAWSILLGADLNGFKFVFDPGDGDGFLRFLIGGDKTEIGLPLGLRWGQDGIRFGGSASFEVVVHPHLSIGPASIDDVDFRLAVPADPKPRVRLEIGAGISGGIGPVSFTLTGVGLRADAIFEPGNAGPFDLDIGFLPPNGVGVSIDGGGFKGGGFLKFDRERGEYSGALELTFAEIVSVRAVGILSTRLPDGKDAFSLLIIIVSEFVPIQLSYGFTLLGVGGLLGLNRTVDLDALQVGVRDGTLNSILFPTDVVANAPRIISDLKRVFPPHEDRFLMGPMGKLGWGTPTLISLEVGLILEIPRPAFAVLGVLRVQLPAEEFGTIYLQVNFSGSVDFEKGQLQFDASLYHSRVLISPLTGDMALRIYWGGDPNFLLTVGGFHPAYTPPPMNIGALSRLGLVITPGIPSVTAEIYFAVTSSTVQFGARVEILYGVKGIFNVFGTVGLDVLIQFNPFMFVAEISAMFGVRAGSTTLFAIQVTGTLKGPTPWHVRGEASFLIGFIIKVRLSANFEVTSGESRNTLLPAIDVLGEIGKALGKAGNWRAALPRGSNQHVSLRALPQTGEALVLHPFGALEIVQKIVPLNIAVQRIGSSRPDRGSVFRIAAAQINSVNVPTTVSTEQFAPGQFFDLDDATKLSRPSFARYDAGIVIGADNAPQADFRRERDVTYEVKYVPEAHPILVIYLVPAALGQAFARGGAAAQSTLSQAVRAPSAVAAEHVSMAPETYAVVSTMDMTLHAAALVFASATAADQAIARLIAEQPELTGAVQVVPSAQVRHAA